MALAVTRESVQHHGHMVAGVWYCTGTGSSFTMDTGLRRVVQYSIYNVTTEDQQAPTTATVASGTMTVTPANSNDVIRVFAQGLP